ncbi:MAG: sigma-E processing peptidase SpoIIGA [Lachnospiraceae bacterium]|nr:sigma-E processing peptidase SpoIIGA [Lachnospiraceae bacterium]
MLQNLCMDYIALASVNCFLKRRRKLRRLLFIAALSSLGSLVIHIYIRNVGFRTILLHFGLNTGMNYLAFGWKDKRTFWENWLFIYMAVLFLGGIMEWEASLGIPGTFFWGKAIVAALLLTGVTIYFTQKKELMEQMFKVDIIHHGKKWELNAYWDSGNLLQDPYNGKPVNILQAKLAEQIFSEKNDYMRLIPYCSLGNANGLLSVYNAEKMYIYQGEKRLEVEPAVFGVAEAGLLEKKEYDVILQASMIEKER